jgi:alkylation response protein AidB-like acyl-CoA dehydrogenase
MIDTHTIRVFLETHHHRDVERLSAFVAKEIAPTPDPDVDDAARARACEIARLLGAAGWLDPIASQDLRGCALTREVLAHTSPLADGVFALQALGTLPFIIAGNKSLHDRWVPRLVSGEHVGAFALTEPEAGSDVASLTTRARRIGENYVLDGRKAFISNAGIADVHVVFATVDPDRGRKGITAFVVPKDTPGFSFGGAQVMSAPHPLGELVFDHCRIPASNRLGDEGAGLRLALGTLDRLRATVGAAACGMAARALEEATSHALSRKQFGAPLADLQLVQEKIARMATDLTAARLLVYRALWEKDGGAERVGLESSMAKAFATEAAQRIVDDAVQIHGGRGVLTSSTVEHLYRAVRSLRIYEGATEVQQLIIAGHVLGAAKEQRS